MTTATKTKPTWAGDTDYKAMAAAIRDGKTTPAQLVKWIADPEVAILEDGVIVINPTTWYVNDSDNYFIRPHGDITPASKEAAFIYADEAGKYNDDEVTPVAITVWHRGIDAAGNLCRVGEETHQINVFDFYDDDFI